MLYKSWAFLKRDLIINSSYKVAFLMRLFQSLLPVVGVFFVGKLLADGQGGHLDKYGGDYFSFALVGIAFTRYLDIAVSTFSGSMRRAQMEGCLEVILSSRTSSSGMVWMSSLYSFIFSGIQLLIMVALGIWVLDADFSQANIASGLVVVVLSLLVFMGLGILSAAGIILFKQGEPVSMIVGALSAIIGGTFFPLEVMPEWLQVIARFVPLTHSLEALRLTWLSGYALGQIQEQLIILGGMAIVFFPLGLWAFSAAVERGKRDGSLMHY